MAEKKKYNSILISGRKDETLTYSKYVKDEESGESVKESLDKKVNVTDELTTQQIKDGAITNEKMAADSVGNTNLQDGSVSNEKLEDGSITNDKLAENSITKDKLQDKTIGVEKLDNELRQAIAAATGLPENLVETIQNVDDTLKDHQRQLDDKQSQIDDKQQQITANDEDISLLQTRSTQMEETIKSIAATGGASQATAVTYNNEKSGLTAVNAQAAIDEVDSKLRDLEFKKKYYNLYNFAYQSGLLVNNKVVEDVNWVTSDYIPFGANKTFEVKLYGGSYGHNIEFFDIDFNIIGTVNDGNNSVYTKEVISPVNTAYIRISVVNDAYRKQQNITEQYIGNSELLNYVEDCSMKSSLNIHYKSVELNNEIYRICLYGDSISSTDYKWYKELMQESTGIDDVYNAGFSGARTAQLAKDAQLQRVLDYSANLVIIEVGGNDVGDVVGTFGMNRTQPVVEQTDISHDYEGTYFIQAVDHIIRKILSQYTAFVPYIAVMTPTPQKRKGGENTWNLHRNWQNKRDAVVECCLKNNIHCIDMFNLWGVDMSKEPSWTSPTNTTESKGIYTMDGLHPNKDGYNRMVQVITSQIKVSGSLKNFGNKLFTSNLDPTGKTTDTKHRTCYLRKVNPHLEKILYKVGVYDVNTSLCIFDKNRNIIDSYTRKGDKIDNSNVFYFDKDAAYYSVMTLAPNLDKSILVEFYKNASSKNILWLGTSIPAGKVEGISYPTIVGEQLGVGVINNAVGSSFISTGCYNFNNPMSNLSSKDLSPGKCLTETVAEKEERFRPKVDDGTISEDDLNTIKSFSYENLVIPYLDRVDTVVIDHGYNDRLVIANELKKKGLDELDWQSRDRETYIGALNYLVDRIKEKYPRMNIIISGHYRADTDECRYICAMQSEIGLHFGFPVLKLWEYAAMSSEVFVKGTSNYLEEFNNTYKTSYTARKKDSDGNITELQICCPDFTHPHSDLSGTTINKIGLILSKLIGGLIND